MEQKKRKNLYKNQETIQKQEAVQSQETIPQNGEEQEFRQKTQEASPEAPSHSSYLSAKGNVRFKMTNDYLFRAVFQSNEKALKGLLCSMLHLKPEEIQTIEITNPIELGKSLDDKTFILDITLKLNDRSIINIEMQVSNWLNWPERSLSYLCRTFDQLMKGEDYLGVQPVTQICFLDFTLFPQFPEFYATYQILNVKNHNLYSDKFTLSVVDLTQAEAATEEDKANGIDQWAALFKATKWEEIKMLSQKSEYLEEASQSMYQLSADERIRQQCIAREENERLERAMQKTKETLDKRTIELDKKTMEIDKKTIELNKKNVELNKKNSELNKKNSELNKKNSELEVREAELQKQQTEFHEQQAEFQEQQTELEKQKAQLKELENQLRKWEAQLKNKISD